jgi:uncharacterized RDD family membrane protein YckC
MSIAPEPVFSAAPPGFTPAAVAPPRPLGLGVACPAFPEVKVRITRYKLGQPADAAIRRRLAAAVADNAIVFGAYLILCLVLHWRVASLGHIWLVLVAGVLYPFLSEIRNGQTIGKRLYGIRVVSVHGGPAGTRAIAVRSALRLIDQLPGFYVAGLLNLVRTGPARRQRLGDIVGGTMVTAENGIAVTRGSSHWLPAATVLGVLASAVLIIGIIVAGGQGLTTAQQSEFITACDNSAGGQVVDCSCLLNRLEAAGYDSAGSLQEMEQAADYGATEGTLGAARAVLVNAAQACRI